MNMVEVTLGWVKYWFPEFEFSWLGVSFMSFQIEASLQRALLGRDADKFT
jgi:hypothetical protein